jgi:hypothetical protein
VFTGSRATHVVSSPDEHVPLESTRESTGLLLRSAFRCGTSQTWFGFLAAAFSQWHFAAEVQSGLLNPKVAGSILPGPSGLACIQRDVCAWASVRSARSAYIGGRPWWMASGRSSWCQGSLL